MKSPYSNSQGNCVDCTIRTHADEDFVVVIDTKAKTGKGAQLLFDQGEWDAFIRAAKEGHFDWEALQDERDEPLLKGERPLTKGERAKLEQRYDVGMARTPENLAYVNGRHAERAGWVPFTIERFAKRYHHDPSAPETARLFDAFQTGRRAEAHDASMMKG
jgi:hypothetical protein